MKSFTGMCLFAMMFGQILFAQSLPKNLLHLDQDRNESSITEEVFNSVIDKVGTVYRPIIESHGATLGLIKDWPNPTVNAFAGQTGTKWRVTVMGGIARDKLMTADGLAFVVCHEFGHHVGGFPYHAITDQWIANEGQSDYFAGFVCARELWKAEFKENSNFREKIVGHAKELCDETWDDREDQDLCYRVAFAGIPLAAITARIYKDPEPLLTERDKNEVAKTENYHPHGQCRLDTVMQSIACGAKFDASLIPGKGDPGGIEALTAEEAAAKVSCLKSSEFTVGLRPRCWFKARIS